MVDAFTLNTGAKIPPVAFGGIMSADLSKVEAFRPHLKSALKLGYRHIDGAALYGTESIIGETIRESEIPRDQIFVTTKLSFFHNGRVQQQFEESLNNFGFDYVDLYLMHWPQILDSSVKNPLESPDGDWKADYSHTFQEAWAEMEKIYESGRAKAIGVSNFSIKNLEKLLTTARVIPAVNQVEIHPYLVQEDLVDYCKKKGIQITAYSSTGRQFVTSDPLLKGLAEKYNCSAVQVIFAWHRARGISIITQSSKEDRRKEAFNLPTLEPGDIERISQLDHKELAYLELDKNGNVFGWSLEQLGWEHLTPAVGRSIFT